jgi:L-malate glycosyltransferase
MKLCFLGDAITHHMRRWTKYFAGKGHDVTVLTFHDKVLNNYDPVKVQVINKPLKGAGLLPRMLNLFPLVIELKKRINEIKPDLIHCHDAGAYSWVSMFTGFHPIIVSAQGNDVLVYPKGSKITKFMTSMGLKKADLVHCDGYEMRDEIIKFGVAPGKIEIVFFGTDVSKFKADPLSKHLKSEKGIQGPVVISTRRLDPIHNIETLIRSARIVLQRVPLTTFVIAGYGEEEAYL